MNRQLSESERAARKAQETAAAAEIGGNLRELGGWQGQLVFWSCVVFTAAHLYILNLQPIDPWVYRSGHVAFGAAIGFLIFGAHTGKQARRVPWYDWVLIALSITCFVYIYVLLDDLLFRAGAAPTQWDMVIGIIGTALILEITRRSAGLALPIIALVFLAYCVAGPLMPGVLYHRGIQIDQLFSFVYSMEGVFGPTTAVSSTYIILFITFAGFLQASKVGDYFIN
ncbi:MAG: TRAP transporter permease, partial [Alphaproteobacteria bacterium]|nr:TRAP transporter permease [Alphaproteobacteria bacterium]